MISHRDIFELLSVSFIFQYQIGQLQELNSSFFMYEKGAIFTNLCHRFPIPSQSLWRDIMLLHILVSQRWALYHHNKLCHEVASLRFSHRMPLNSDSWWFKKFCTSLYSSNHKYTCSTFHRDAQTFHKCKLCHLV